MRTYAACRCRSRPYPPLPPQVSTGLPSPFPSSVEIGQGGCNSVTTQVAMCAYDKATDCAINEAEDFFSQQYTKLTENYLTPTASQFSPRPAL
jgi:hypothetical protein